MNSTTGTPPMKKAPIDPSDHESTPMSVLIVEDSDTQAKIIESLIRRWKKPCIVSRVAMLKDALSVLEDYCPTVILLDLCLPDSDGIKTVQSIVPMARGVAIIVLTAKANDEIGEQAMAEGAQDFLSKEEMSEKMLYRAFRHAVQRQRIINANAHLTEQLNSERALLSDLINHVPYYIVWKDRDLRYTGCNKAFAEFVGMNDTKDVVGLLPRQLPGIVSGVETLQAEDAVVLATGESMMHQEKTFRFSDGRCVTLLASRVPLLDEGRRPIGVLGIYADITEQKLMQVKLAQAQKLESIGQLAAGIAHEINTPTQYVSNNTHFLREQFKTLLTLTDQYAKLLDNPPANFASYADLVRLQLKELDYEFARTEIPAAVEQSLEGLERIATIVRAMKDFSHPGTEKKEPSDINKAIDSTITICRARWKYIADLEREFDPSLREVPCVVAELNQVVLNLVVNSADAIATKFGDGSKGKGLIRVRTRRNGDHAEIVIQDNGCGIPDSIKHRIFDPFFTTKEVGKGTGQGLAISRDVIVNRHNGTIDCQSTPETGTIFTIRLPLSANTEKEAA